MKQYMLHINTKFFFLLFHHSCCFPVSTQLYLHWQQLSSDRLCNRYTSYCYLLHYCCIFSTLYINIPSVIIFIVTGIFIGSVRFFYLNLNSMAFMIVAATCHKLVILVLASIILIRIPFARRLSTKFYKIFKGFKQC